MEARKANKVYQIDKAQADEYAAAGYDVYEGKKLVMHAVGAAVPVEAHEKALAEIEALKAELAALKAKK